MKWILILLLCSSFAFAYDPEITQLALLLNTSDTAKTVMLVDVVVDSLIDYEYNSYSKGISRTWSDKTGDCTDRAELKQFMLYKAGIEARLVHGYDLNNVKHDWYEYHIDQWVSVEPYSKKVGNGVW